MTKTYHHLSLCAGLLLTTALAGCGGGTGTGGSNSLSFPDSDQPSSVPVQQDYDTSEYRENYGLDAINAIAAYDSGLSGEGVSVAVIDTGIDLTHPDLDGAILGASTNIVTGQHADVQDADDTTGHGTAVAGIIAAEKNDAGIHGVAFNSKLLAISAVDPAACTADDCSFSQADLAQAVDYARLQGARVINLSLGGAAAGSTLTDAMQRAVDAGITIVLSAGNESLAEPSDFAAMAGADWANNQIIIAGASNTNDQIADFSNRAGLTLQDLYVVAPGVLVTTTDAGGGFKIVSGTSFSAPHVAGAVALLLEMFPNLTARDVVEILLTSARDLGVPGVDMIYGQGLVDLAAALAPAGPVSIAVDATTTPAGSDSALTLNKSGLELSAAFGNALNGAEGLEAAMGLDRYRRSYRLDLGQRTLYARATPDLTAIMDGRRMEAHETVFESSPFTTGPGHRLSVRAEVRWDRTEAEWAARYMDGKGLSDHSRPEINARLALSLGPHTDLEAVHGSPEGLTFGTGLFLQSAGRDLVTGLTDRNTRIGLSHTPTEWMTWTTRFMTGSAPYSLVDDDTARMTGVQTEMALMPADDVKVAVNLSSIKEHNAVLGSRSAGAMKLGNGAQTVGGGLGLAWTPGQLDFYMEGSLARTTVTAADRSLIRDISGLWSSSWRAGITSQDLLTGGDRLGFEISQPLRVEGGKALIHTVAGRDYTVDRLLTGQSTATLAPTGREIRLQGGYAVAFTPSNALRFQVIHQIDAGHRQNLSASAFLVDFSQKF
jgi:hypothetical protein